MPKNRRKRELSRFIGSEESFPTSSGKQVCNWAWQYDEHYLLVSMLPPIVDVSNDNKEIFLFGDLNCDFQRKIVLQTEKTPFNELI